MIYRISKILALICSISAAVIMGVILLSEQFLPEKFYSENGDVVSLPGIYGRFFTVKSNYGISEPAISTEEISRSAKIQFMGTIPVKEVSITVTDEKIVTICGSPFGVKMFTDGVLVVGFSEIKSSEGPCCPALEAGLEKGDIIKSVNGKDVFTNEEVAQSIENCCGENINFKVLRKENIISINVLPKMLADNSGYKAGFWVRDSAAGIGTMTFYDPKTMTFAGLGHAVCDVDTGGAILFSSGEITPAAITKIRKGVSGAPGELGGVFTGGDIGTVSINNETGLYGTLDYEIEGFSAPIGLKQDVYEGAAVIYSTLDGTEVTEYDIEIEQINLSDNSMTKNMVIRVTDEDLIELSGGIVQGMSGSPIVQDGKLVGAVTHVFVNDPTKGFGIFAENMMEMAEKCR